MRIILVSSERELSIGGRTGRGQSLGDVTNDSGCVLRA